MDDATEEFLWPEPFKEDTDNLDLSLDDSIVEKWIVKNKKIHIRIVTWNLGAKTPPTTEKMNLVLLPKNK